MEDMAVSGANLETRRETLKRGWVKESRQKKGERFFRNGF
jgi:hypothetical protein